MFNSVKKALGYRDVFYNIKSQKYFTNAVGDEYAELPVVSGNSSTVEIESQSGRSANIFVDNASIAVIDTETINSILDANCYLLNKSPITDDLATLITSNAGENYYLYAYDGEYDENFPYGAELIVKLTKEEAAICSLSPYFTAASGSIIEQATRNYPFLMADRRELDKLRAAVASYYLGQAYDNAAVLTKQAYWQTALEAAVSGSIVSTWKVLTDMATAAASNGVNISSDFLNDNYPSGIYYPPGGGTPESPSIIRFNYWSNSVLNGNFGSYMQIGRRNGSVVGIPGGNKHYIVFNLALNWTQFTTDYLTLTLDGPSGSYTWNLADAEKQPGDLHYWIEMDSSSQIADDAAARVLTEELATDTYSPYSQLWTITVQSAAAPANEDDAVLSLVMQNIGGHIIKYPRYGVANPPVAGTYTKSFAF
ncbi:hypothetical protein N8654_01920 [Synechococcus sp. AH-601-B19]|nr:hypothetical protein [Synechococcus sp. AH-601-B19]